MSLIKTRTAEFSAVFGVRSQSLTRRVVVLSSLWAIVAIFALGWMLVGLFKNSVNQSFEELQLAQLYSLIAAVDVSNDGVLSGSPDLGDANFQRIGSGWYWQVSERTNPLNALKSPSLADTELTAPTLDEVPLQTDFTRRYVVGNEPNSLTRVFETEIALRDGFVAVFQVGGSETGFRNTISAYTRQIAGLLGTFALGLIVINTLVILFGLRPLERLRNALSDIRSGEAESLVGRYPDEIQPLADELNLMINNNRRIIERSRTQVGNLAHSLKTPLSVLINAADDTEGPSRALVREQSGAMQYQIQHYLDRARIAAQRDAVAYRTDALAATEKLVAVLSKLNPEKSLKLNASKFAVIFAGEKEDFDEIVGNLLENACKWAKRDINVALEVEEQEASRESRDWLILTVDDDGPGIERDKRAEALKRGQRMDETVAGTGLGLSIVVETVRSYGGEVVLKEAPQNGLRAMVRLPALRE